MARLRSLTDAAKPASSAPAATGDDAGTEAAHVARLSPRLATKGREGKKMVAGWYDKAAVKQLQGLALEEETTIQDLVGEALNLLFRNRGLPALARVEEPMTHGA